MQWTWLRYSVLKTALQGWPSSNTQNRVVSREIPERQLRKCRGSFRVALNGSHWSGKDRRASGSKEYAVRITPTALRARPPFVARGAQGTIMHMYATPTTPANLFSCFIRTFTLSRVRQTIYIRLQPGKSISMCRYRMSRKRECGGALVFEGSVGSPRMRIEKRNIECP